MLCAAVLETEAERRDNQPGSVQGPGSFWLGPGLRGLCISETDCGILHHGVTP